MPHWRLGNGSAFVLCQRGQNGEKQLTRAVHRADVLLLKGDADAQIFQLSGIVQAVLGVPGKSADRLCDDEVDFASLAISNHTVELLTPFGAGAGDTFICVNTSQFIIGVSGDELCVVGHLVFKAVQLFVCSVETRQ